MLLSRPTFNLSRRLRVGSSSCRSTKKLATSSGRGPSGLKSLTVERQNSRAVTMALAFLALQQTRRSFLHCLLQLLLHRRHLCLVEYHDLASTPIGINVQW